MSQQNLLNSQNSFHISDRLGREQSFGIAKSPSNGNLMIAPMLSDGPNTQTVLGFSLTDINFEHERFLRFDGELKGHSGAIYCAAFSRTVGLLASGGIDRTIRIWDTSYPYKQV